MRDTWWRNMDNGHKSELLRTCGWRTNKGTLAPTGKRLLNQSWDSIPQGTQNIILRNGGMP